MLMKMRSKMQKTNNQKGFTLVELMVVVVIIGILTAIAVPVYSNISDNANRRAVEANLRTIDSAIMSHQAINLGTAPTVGNLTGTHIQSWPAGPAPLTAASYTVVGTGAADAPYRAAVTIAENTFGTHTAKAAVSLPFAW